MSDIIDCDISAAVTLAHAGGLVPRHPMWAIKRYVDLELERRFASIDVDGYVSAADLEAMPVVRFLKLYFLIGLLPSTSDRALCRRAADDKMLRWFLDMTPDETSIDHVTYGRIRRRLRWHPSVGEFFSTVMTPVRLQLSRGRPNARLRDCNAPPRMQAMG